MEKQLTNTKTLDLKRIYGKRYVWDEIIAFPMLGYYFLTHDKIKQELSKRIKNAEKRAEETKLTLEYKDDLLDSYLQFENFFSHHFKIANRSRHRSFDRKIEICLNEFKKESKRRLSASKILILQESFLKGAEDTLFVYFALKGKVSRDITLSDIIIDDENYSVLIEFLKDKKYIDENRNFVADNKSIFIRLHNLLKDKKIINNDFQNTTIIEAMNNEYNETFNVGIFSKGIYVKKNEFEESLQSELLKRINDKL